MASFEDNEENKQGGEAVPGNNPERVMEQFEAQDDQKIAGRIGGITEE